MHSPLARVTSQGQLHAFSSLYVLVGTKALGGHDWTFFDCWFYWAAQQRLVVGQAGHGRPCLQVYQRLSFLCGVEWNECPAPEAPTQIYGVVLNICRVLAMPPRHIQSLVHMVAADFAAFLVLITFLTNMASTASGKQFVCHQSPLPSPSQLPRKSLQWPAVLALRI